MTRFNPVSGLIIVVIEVWGPGGSRLARLALDTGATASVIDAAILVSIGYDPALASSRTRMTTGSGVEFAADRSRFPEGSFGLCIARHSHHLTCATAAALRLPAGLTARTA
jgi:hypothetical protein